MHAGKMRGSEMRERSDLIEEEEETPNGQKN